MVFKLDRQALGSSLELMTTTYIPGAYGGVTAGLYYSPDAPFYTLDYGGIFSGTYGTPPLSSFQPLGAFAFLLSFVWDYTTFTIEMATPAYYPTNGELVSNGTNPNMFMAFSSFGGYIGFNVGALILMCSVSTSGGGGDMIVDTMPTGSFPNPEGWRIQNITIDFSGLVTL